MCLTFELFTNSVQVIGIQTAIIICETRRLTVITVLDKVSRNAKYRKSRLVRHGRTFLKIGVRLDYLTYPSVASAAPFATPELIVLTLLPTELEQLYIARTTIAIRCTLSP